MLNRRSYRRAPFHGGGRVAALLTVGALTACGDGVSLAGTANVRVLLTDAPIDYIGAATVDIGRVELIPADDGAPVVLADDGTDGPVDLLTLQDAATQLIADAEIPAGTYAQLRLIVESASVALAAGFEFNDGTTEQDLFVPSGAQTGIKLLLGGADEDEADGALLIPEGDLVLVVDFDVSRSFVLQGNPLTPAGISGVLFKPTLRVAVLDVAGAISGTVSTQLGSVDVEGLSVTGTPVDEGALEAYQAATATTLTDAEGDYSLRFLVPGSYWVKVGVAAPLLTVPDSILVDVGPSQDVPDIDFEIVDGS